METEDQKTSKKALNWINDHEKMLEKIVRWMVLGVVASLYPVLHSAFQNWVFDSRFKSLELLCDLLLVIFAISAGALGLVWDGEKKIARIAKMLLGIALAAAMFWSMNTYSTFFAQTSYNNHLLEEFDTLIGPLETASPDMLVDGNFNENIQQLISLKEISSKLEASPNKLDCVRNISIGIVLLISLCGIGVEYFDDRLQRSKKEHNGGSNSLNKDSSGKPSEKEDE